MLGVNFVDVATKALIGQDVPAPVDLMAIPRSYVATKVRPCRPTAIVRKLTEAGSAVLVDKTCKS